MLVGLILSDQEASISDINNYLNLIIDELLELYKGMEMKTHKHSHGTLIHAILLMINAGIPAC